MLVIVTPFVMTRTKSEFMHRRQVLKNAVAASVLPLFAGAERAYGSQTEPEPFPVNFLVSRQTVFWSTAQERERYAYLLGRAVLDFVQEYFPSGDLPIWRRPLASVDLEKRVVNILHWMVRGVDAHQGIYPVDPAWLMAQMLEESFFYEFAVSWAFAVGVCQFISPTATTLGLVCPKSEYQESSGIRNPELAGEKQRLRELSQRRRKLKQKHRLLFYDPQRLLADSLAAHRAGTSLPETETYLQALEEVKGLEEAMQEARRQYRTFLQSNYQGRDIFRQSDVEFLNRFDQRVLYRLPVQAMVRMMAEHLRGRSGNILAATAGYNAGLPSTRYPYRIYEPYGMVPAYRETVRYVCKIAINYQEIIKRM